MKFQNTLYVKRHYIHKYVSYSECWNTLTSHCISCKHQERIESSDREQIPVTHTILSTVIMYLENTLRRVAEFFKQHFVSGIRTQGKLTEMSVCPSVYFSGRRHLCSVNTTAKPLGNIPPGSMRFFHLS